MSVCVNSGSGRRGPLTSAVDGEGALAARVQRERALAARVQRVVVGVHEGQRLVAVGPLLRVALVHGVDHHRHLLTRAAQGLLALFGQFPSRRREEGVVGGDKKQSIRQKQQ